MPKFRVYIDLSEVGPKDIVAESAEEAKEEARNWVVSIIRKNIKNLWAKEYDENGEIHLD